MNCEQLRQHYELYALDIAEDPERAEIRAHLNRGCEVCVGGVKRALETASLIGASAPTAQPSRDLRRRILASVGSEHRGFRWFPALATALAMAALLVVTVYFAVRSRGYSQQAASLEQALRTQTAQLLQLTQAFDIVSGPRTTEVSFGGAQPRPPQGKVFVNPDRGVLLIASNLPRTPADKIYEMWIIRKGKGAKPVPAGLFQSQDDGSALHVQPGVVDMASAAAIAVTVENQAGVNQPTTMPLIVAPLAAAN
jgi:hypothetical protein